MFKHNSKNTYSSFLGIIISWLTAVVTVMVVVLSTTTTTTTTGTTTTTNNNMAFAFSLTNLKKYTSSSISTGISTRNTFCLQSNDDNNINNNNNTNENNNDVMISKAPSFNGKTIFPIKVFMNGLKGHKVAAVYAVLNNQYQRGYVLPTTYCTSMIELYVVVYISFIIIINIYYVFSLKKKYLFYST